MLRNEEQKHPAEQGGNYNSDCVAGEGKWKLRVPEGCCKFSCGSGSGFDRVGGEREQMQNVVHVLKNWYPTSILPEPKFRAREAVHRRLEGHLAEVDQIVEKAKKNGVYLKAPNGEQTNLTVERWALVRTKAFKQEFGDWERAAQIAKLLKSEPIVATGEEWKGKYELNRHSATKYVLESLRGGYANKDTCSMIRISRKATKATTHRNEMHLKVLAFVTQVVEKSIYLGEESNEKNKRGFDCFRYYAARLKIGDADYVVRLTTGVDKNGETYYDHALTKIKKRAASPDQRDLLQSQVYDQETTLSAFKDERLPWLLQGDFSTFPNLVDENGEPKSAQVEAFERKHADIQLLQLTWIKQDDKAFGWFNPTTNAIVLCEGCAISTTLEAFWHATFYFTKKNAPKLHNKMLMFAQDASKSIKYARKKFYPELKAGSVAWFDKLGAMRFVMDYADKIEESLDNEKSFFAKVLRVFSGDRVNLVGIGRRPPEKAVAALAHAFASGKLV